MKVRSIASGSSGNAYAVEHDGRALLIDCGVPYKHLKDLAIDAVLITHSHSDHVSGLKVLLKHCDAPVFANSMTAETVARCCGLDDEVFVRFENDQVFEVGDFEISPFSIPHDTSDPVGYLVRLASTGVTYFHGTDIGTPLESIGNRLARADIAVLESNHDPVLLRQSSRPSSLIQRIAGPRGHLSNDQACELVRRFASPRLKKLALAHLSRDCNMPHLAEEAMRSALQEIGRADVELKVLCPDEIVEL